VPAPGEAPGTLAAAPLAFVVTIADRPTVEPSQGGEVLGRLSRQNTSGNQGQGILKYEMHFGY
jgi:hypothetical protein